MSWILFINLFFGEKIYCIEPIYISRYVHKAPMLLKALPAGPTIFKHFCQRNFLWGGARGRGKSYPYWQTQLHHTSAVYTKKLADKKGTWIFLARCA